MWVVAGDFKTGFVWIKRSILGKPKALGFRKSLMKNDMVPLSSITSFVIADREKTTSWLTKLVGGAAMGAVLGPAGAIGGMLASGSKDETMAELQAADGRRALVKGPSKEIQSIYLAVYTLQSVARRRLAGPNTRGDRR